MDEELPISENGSVWKEEAGSGARWIRFSLKEIMEATDTRGICLKVENHYGRMLGEPIRKKALQSFAKCVRVCVLVGGKHVYDGNIRMKFVNLGFVSRGCCCPLSDYNRSRSKIKITRNGGCLLHEQKVYATHESGAERKVMSSFALIRSESEEEKKMWTGNVLLLFCCAVSG